MQAATPHATAPLSARHRAAGLPTALALVLLAGCAAQPLPPYNPPPLPRHPAPAQRAPVQQVPVRPVPGVQVTPVPAPGQTEAPASQTDANAHLVTLAADLNGAEAVPATASRAQGRVAMVYNSQTRLLRWKATLGELSGTISGVSFNGPGFAGDRSPVVLNWPGPLGTAYEGRATLNNEQASDLMGGRWYVNVRTSAYPSGEIRGQVTVRN